VTDLLLLRHAESVWNEDGRFQGWADPPLSDTGYRAARSWASGVAVSFDAVVSSDLIRSRLTAELIAQAIGISGVDVRRGLREQDQGAWTGLTKAEVKRIWPQLARQRPRRPYGGEDQADFTGRVLAGLEELASLYSELRVLVVVHAGVIKAVERVLGCDDIPVSHLQGRWILRSGSVSPLISQPPLALATNRWVAGGAEPEGRTMKQVLAADSMEHGL
jgi:broad specificity phosphatase PhoE